MQQELGVEVRVTPKFGKALRYAPVFVESYCVCLGCMEGLLAVDCA
jgi:hypothetical protein